MLSIKDKGRLLQIATHCERIKGMRDIIGHGYGTIDLEIVWNTAKTNIKDLHKYINTVLEDK